MPYTYDTDRAPLWVDSRRMDLEEQAQSLRQFSPTQPAPMDAGQLRRDSIAAASQAPRIPRNRPIIGTSRQGRVIHRAGDAQRPTEPLVSRLESIEDAGHSLIWLLCLAVLMVIVPALIFGVNWADVISLLAAIGGAL